MKFALLGDNPGALPWLNALASGGHQLMAVALADHSLAQSTFASVRRVGWEQLLTDGELDAVLIAGDSDEVQSAAKQLAAEKRPLLILPDVAFGIATAYELSLIRDDTGVVLMSAFAHRGDAEFPKLAEELRAGGCGAVRRLQIDVEVPTAAGIGDQLTESKIEAAALADIDLLRWLGGNYDQVTSLRSGQSEHGCSQATLTLAGTGLPDAMWTIRQGSSPGWRLKVESERNTSEFVRDASLPRSDRFAAVVAQFANATRGESLTFDWSDAVRVFDILDAARRSLRRRRTIDVQFETLSERQQFKTQMTAIGCGLLMLTLMLMLGLLGLGAIFDARDRSVRDARAAGLVFTAADFLSESPNLSESTNRRLDEIAERLKSDLATAFVEPATDPANPELDQNRRTEVARALTDRGVLAADHRTRIAPVQSTAWETVMRVLRIAWIIPLLLFLALQLLLFVARPGQTRSSPS